MVKKISGYVRSIQTAAGISEKTVTIRFDDGMGLVVPAGGMYGSSANPITTDSNGYFEWTTELSPGPVRVEADIVDGMEVKINSGKETMQVGEAFLSDMLQGWSHLADGVVWQSGYSDGFKVSAVTGQRQVTVAVGLANMRGRVLETSTPRTLVIDPNTTLATRIDRVVLEHHVGGAYAGRQNITIIKGTANGVLPPSNTNPNIFQLPIAEVTISQNASAVTVVDRRVYAYPHYLNIPANFITVDMLGPTVDTAIVNAADSWPGLGIQQAGVTKGSGNKFINFTGNVTVTAGTGGVTVHAPAPAAGSVTSSIIADNSITSAKIVNGTITESDLKDGIFETRHLRQIFPANYRLRTNKQAHRVRFHPGYEYETQFTMEPGTPLHRFSEDTVYVSGMNWYYCYVYWRGFGWVGWISTDFEAV